MRAARKKRKKKINGGSIEKRCVLSVLQSCSFSFHSRFLFPLLLSSRNAPLRGQGGVGSPRTTSGTERGGGDAPARLLRSARSPSFFFFLSFSPFVGRKKNESKRGEKTHKKRKEKTAISSPLFFSLSLSVCVGNRRLLRRRLFLV